MAQELADAVDAVESRFLVPSEPRVAADYRPRRMEERCAGAVDVETPAPLRCHAVSESSTARQTSAGHRTESRSSQPRERDGRRIGGRRYITLHCVFHGSGTRMARRGA